MLIPPRVNRHVYSYGMLVESKFIPVYNEKMTPFQYIYDEK